MLRIVHIKNGFIEISVNASLCVGTHGISRMQPINITLESLFVLSQELV